MFALFARGYVFSSLLHPTNTLAPCRNVQVTLQVLSALIEKVPRDLPIYARSVLSVIETVLRSNEISIVEDSVPTFETFCRYQDMAALTAEKDFAIRYRGVVQSYAELADPNPSVQAKSPQIAIRWRNAGLRAIRSVVGSEDLSDEEVVLPVIVMPVVLKNLYAGEEDMLVSLQLQLQDSEKKDTEQRVSQDMVASAPAPTTSDTPEGDAAVASQSTADADKKAEMETRLLALRCLERMIVSGSTRGQIRTATTLILQFIISKSQPGDAGRDEALRSNSQGYWATSLIELVAKWCPVQTRFVILVTAMEILLQTDSKNLQRMLTMACMVDWLLKSTVNMIGLSVIDVLLGLLQTISRVLRPESRRPTTGARGTANGDGERNPPGTADEALRNQLLTYLEQCVGSLATHVYYADQVADIIRAILVRIRSSENQDSPMSDQLSNLRRTVTNNTATPTQVDTGFYSVAGKVISLRAVKNVLLVANLRKFVVAGVESRRSVGIHVWEGTHWLLCDASQDVRHAYADALLSWMDLETDKGDLRINDGTEKQPSYLSKHGPSDFVEKPGKRTFPTNLDQRERAQSNFLRLLHLTVYEVALGYPGKHSEYLLLHLLLTSLVQSFGVNAVRFGLPMILRLQDDMNTVPSLRSSSTSVNVGSLVYGYLMAICDRFDLRSSQIEAEIGDEIEKRKRQGAWLQGIRLPPIPLGSIVSRSGAETKDSGSGSVNTLMPFRSVEGLVQQIEQAYNYQSTKSAQSPSTSPTRGPAAPTAQKSTGLPTAVKEQMLESWSREGSLAAAESESPATVSTNGSRRGTATTRNNHFFADGGYENSRSGSVSQMSLQPNTPGIFVSGTGAGVQGSSRHLNAEGSGSLDHSAGKELPVRVNDLRRVLTDHQPRRLSPLRGRLDPSSSRGEDSSSGESMVSGAFSTSEYGDRASVKTQSIKDGLDTPRPTSPKPAPEEYFIDRPQSRQIDDTNNNNNINNESTRTLYSEAIPPVPPIPPSLSVKSDTRPLTAPGRPRRSSVRSSGKNGNQNNITTTTTTAPSTTPRRTRSLNRRKSHSNTALAPVHDADYSSLTIPPPNHNTNSVPSALEGSLDPTERDDLRKLLDGYLSPPAHQNGVVGVGNGNGNDGEHLARTRTCSSSRGRRNTGIGKPPY